MTTAPKSFYVRRTRLDDGYVGWTGSIRSPHQAEKEAEAWRSTGDWAAEVVPNTPAIRAEVRAWVQRKGAR